MKSEWTLSTIGDVCLLVTDGSHFSPKSVENGEPMPIEQVQQLLGHQKIDTTMHYAMVKQQNVKMAHRKFIG